jgi:hypothetical protein
MAMIKGSMFEVSSWLLELEKLSYQRHLAEDTDLSADEINADFAQWPQEGGDGDREGEGEGGEEWDEAQSIYSERQPPPTYFQDSKSNTPSIHSIHSIHSVPPPFTEEGGVEGGSSEDGESIAPPAYDDNEKAAPTAITTTGSGEGVEEGSYSALAWAPPPPQYIPIETAPLTPCKPSSSLRRSFPSHLGAIDDPEPPMLDRMTLLFHSLVSQQNNQARWLGPNAKLTRLKLEGGLKGLLKLEVDWCQFDALWTKIDYRRSGDIDLDEFKRFFGDLSEFETLEGTQSLNISG